MIPAGWAIAWEGVPWWLLLAAAAAGAAALVISARRLTPALGVKGRLILLTRGMIIALLLIMMAGPTMARREEVPVRTPLGVVIDISGSMSRKDDQSSPRLARAVDLARRLKDLLEPDFILRWFTVGARLGTVDFSGLTKLEATDSNSRLAAGLEQLAAESPDLGKILILSDGVDTDPGRLKAGPLSLPSAAVAFGPPTPVPDLRIDRLDFPPLVVTGREAAVTAVLSAEGLKGATVQIVARSGPKVLVSRQITVADDQWRGEVELPFVPEAPGPAGLEIIAGPHSAEVETDNNRSFWTGIVNRDVTRALFVAGAPDWTYDVLRWTFKKDPSNDLISFIILRHIMDVMDVGERESSLVPFPVETIFDQELSTFQLLVLHNFSPWPYLRPNLVDNIVRQVGNGQGLIWVGGPLALGMPDNLRLGLDPLFPFTPPKNQPFSPEPVTLLPPSGNHPVSRALASLLEGKETVVRGYQRTEGIDPRAAVILEGKTADGSRKPMVTAVSRGEGRVLAFLFDDLWRLAFREDNPLAGQGFDDLFRVAAQWLLEPWRYPYLRIEAPEKAIRPGETADFSVTALDHDYRPTPETVEVTLIDPQGAAVPIPGRREPGETAVAVSITPPAPGLYGLQVRVSGGGPGRETIRYLPVSRRTSESDHPNPDLVFLNRLIGENRVLTEKDPDLARKVANLLLPEQVKVLGGERKVLIWANPYFPTLLILLLGVDWGLRRRFGLG